MFEFDKNAPYLLTIVGLGLAVPTFLAIYAIARAKLSKAKLARLKQDEDQA